MVIQWAHTSFIAVPAQWWLENVVNTAEESTKAALREYLSLFARVINGIASWLVAIFIDRDFYRNRQLERKRSRAWRDFWAHNKKTGTLNAVIEREGFISRRSPTPSPRGYSPRSSHLQQSQESGWWPFNTLNRSSLGPASSENTGMKRSGSDLFNRPSGFAVSERMERRGLGETIRLSLELTIEAVFTAFRSTVAAVLFLRATPKGASPPQFTDHLRHDAATIGGTMGSFENDLDIDLDSLLDENNKSRRNSHPSDGGLRRTRSFGSFEDLGVWTASDIILQAGYPLEEHIVTTSDGYILTMQRIPRKDSKEVVFFQHGILDTSLGWVSNGTEGSQAFAAYDRGADVFLGNCRANPPRAHADASKSGASYWCYSINELGMEDVAAQVHRIHAVKTAELGRGGGGAGGYMGSVVGGDGKDSSPWQSFAVRPSPRTTGSTPRPGLHKRSGSDSALAAAHMLEVATERMTEEDGEGAAPPNEQQIRAHILALAKNSSRGSSLDRGSPRSKSTGALTPAESVSPEQEQRGRKGFFGAFLARSTSNPESAAASPQKSGEEAGSALGGSSQRRRDSLKRMFSPKRAENQRSGLSPRVVNSTQTLNSSTTKRLSALQRLKSYNVLSREEEVPLEDEEIDEVGPLDATCTISTARTAGKTHPPKGIPPLRLQSQPNPTRSASFRPRSSSPSSSSCAHSRAPSPERVPTPEDSIESTPRSALLLTHPLTTPDRVSIGGKEQPRMQWGRASSLGLNALGGSTTGTGLYRLQAVGHSLGGAALLIYAVMCRVLGRPHHLSRLVLLTPAGFHRKYPKVATPFLYLLPVIVRLLNFMRPGVVSQV